jgi:glycosyltransferase involved in cell wall biosynthesis
MISFVTVIKIIQHDYSSALHLYIESIVSQITCEFEIIIVEDICEKNTARFQPPDHPCVRLLEYHAAYPNPYGYPLIEAFAKNVGIRAARFPYVCVTNCDILFSPEFFPFVATLQPKTFYRFLQYELLAEPTSLADALTAPAHFLNPALQTPHTATMNDIAYKSGDIMLLDRKSWDQIRGFPENTVWLHSDLIVCKVCQNNGFSLLVPNIKIFTAPHYRPALPVAPALETSYLYLKAVSCNPLL